MPTLSQVILWQNPETDEIFAEIPRGAGRQKIPLPADKSQWGQILADHLSANSQWLKAQAGQKKELDEMELQRRADRDFAYSLARHRGVWDTSASRKNQGIEFANETFGPRRANGKVIPNVKRLLNAL